jgi:tetratricopeptide (TPR) repeat protein
VFWKFIEIIVRILYFRRFYKAKKIGEAGELLANGKPDAALKLLEKHGNSMHESLIPLFAFTQGKVLDALGRIDEAEKAYQAVVLTSPSNSRADFELALIAGRKFDFVECRKWLNRAIDKEDEVIKERATEVLNLLDSIENGTRETEFKNRAEKLSKRKVTPENLEIGFPPSLDVIKKWLESDKEDAVNSIDEIALLLGQAEVANGGKWKIALAIDDTVVIKKDSSQYHPFKEAASILGLE